MASKTDLKTQQAIQKMKDSVDDPKFKTISAQQKALSQDTKARGSVWVSRVNLPPPPEHDVAQILLRAMQILGAGDESFAAPTLAPVRGEWVGYRKNVDRKTIEPDIREEEKYAALMAEVSTTATLLFVHGGAFYWGAPSIFRDLTGALAKLTGGRCFSVAYRLAPQNPFPAAILDVLVAYLSLLYPPVGACHAPVLPSSIVLVGDSSGAGICLAVIQLILTIHRQSVDPTPTIRFFGQKVLLALPSGFAGISTSADMTHSQRSWVANAPHDVLPHVPPPIRASQPPCENWPSNPPRGDIYCDLSALCHPLISPTAAEDWSGAPPMWFCYGEEMLADEGAIIAQQAARQGVCVIWEQFEGMPHSFPGYLNWLPQTAQCFKDWAKFCKQCVEGSGDLGVQSGFIEAQGLRHRPINEQNLGVVPVEIAKSLMKKERERRQAQFEQRYQTKAKI